MWQWVTVERSKVGSDLKQDIFTINNYAQPYVHVVSAGEIGKGTIIMPIKHFIVYRFAYESSWLLLFY